MRTQALPPPAPGGAVRILLTKGRSLSTRVHPGHTDSLAKDRPCSRRSSHSSASTKGFPCGRSPGRAPDPSVRQRLEVRVLRSQCLRGQGREQADQARPSARGTPSPRAAAIQSRGGLHGRLLAPSGHQGGTKAKRRRFWGCLPLRSAARTQPGPHHTRGAARRGHQDVGHSQGPGSAPVPVPSVTFSRRHPGPSKPAPPGRRCHARFLLPDHGPHVADLPGKQVPGWGRPSRAVATGVPAAAGEGGGRARCGEGALGPSQAEGETRAQRRHPWLLKQRPCPGPRLVPAAKCWVLLATAAWT